MKSEREQKERRLELLRERDGRIHYNAALKFFTDGGITARTNYVKHIEFFDAGSEYLERVMFGANQSGKTVSGGFEWMLHLTGRYPVWWKGKRFTDPVTLWAVGVDNIQVKDVIQELMIGRQGDFGSGLIPKRLLVGKPTSKAGVAGGVQDVYVRHISGGVSKLTFKSYQQSLESFMGSTVHGVWFDEEPPRNIYDECLLRVVKLSGIINNTFTPLKGFSDVVLEFLPDSTFPDDHIVKNKGTSKWITRIEWDDIPHLDEATKIKISASITSRDRDARTKGLPSLGTSAVYPVSEDMFVVKDFELPKNLKKTYSICVSWDGAHILFAGYDDKSDVLYIYDEYKGGDMPPAVHKEVINQHGGWQNGTFLFSAKRTNKTDLKEMHFAYAKLGLNVFPSDFSMRVGILQVYNRMSTGRLKVSSKCKEWIKEYRTYAYDDMGNIKGKAANRAKDALMECTQSLSVHGSQIANYERKSRVVSPGRNKLGRNSVTGY